TREGAERIPEDLRIVVTVVVDESRRDDPPVGLDDPPRGSVEAPELYDLSVGDSDVAVAGGPARAIDDAAVLDQQVVGHVFLLSQRPNARATATTSASVLCRWKDIRTAPARMEALMSAARSRSRLT